MKVAHLINSMFTGGAENLIVESIAFFNKNNLDITVVLLNGSETPFLSKLKNAHCRIISLSHLSVYNPLLIFKIIPILRQFDIIHVHLFPGLYWVAIAKMISFSPIKLIFTEHNTTNTRLENRFFLLFDNFIYKFYTKIICISTAIEQVLQAKIPATIGKTVVIENGINLEKSSETNNLTASELFSCAELNTKFITQVAGFRPQKDQKTAIRAMTLLPKDFVLLLVGDGTEKKVCQDLVNQLNLQNQVVFLGIRSDAQQILELTHFVILSSHYEGLSLSSIEGLNSGKPFIASDVAGLHEVVSGAGLLFPESDFKSLANHILELNANDEYYAEIVNKCQERAKKFDINTMITEQIELYKSFGI